MKDTTCCIFCEYGDHEHPAYDASVMRCGCACHTTKGVKAMTLALVHFQAAFEDAVAGATALKDSLRRFL